MHKACPIQCVLDSMSGMHSSVAYWQISFSLLFGQGIRRGKGNPFALICVYFVCVCVRVCVCTFVCEPVHLCMPVSTCMHAHSKG